MTAALLLVAAALARDPNPGLVMPGAAPLGDGAFDASVGGLFGAVNGVSLAAEYGFSDQVSAGLVVPVSSGVLGAAGHLRALVYEDRWLTASVWGLGIAGRLEGFDELQAGAGLSFEVGTQDVRLDASAPLVFTPVNPLNDPAWAVTTLFEAGVSVFVQTGDLSHALRAGVATAFAPIVSYRLGNPTGWVELRYAHLPLSEGYDFGPLVTVTAGARFGG